MLSDRIPYRAAPDAPRLRLPGGAPVAVWVIVNVEDWRIDAPLPRTVLPPPMGRPRVPDVPNWAWHEYGMRAGFWRQHAALTDRGLPATLALNASVVARYPRVAEAALAAGWEFMGHGHMQRPMHDLEDERAEIARAMHTIEAFCGRRPAAWESPGLTETDATIDLLAEAGVRYVADWVIDDLPQRVETPSGPVWTLPYSVETNDIVVHALQHQPAAEFLSRGRAQFDRLAAEGAVHGARVMAISVHPYITGVPHRIGALEALLDHCARGGACWMTASEIGDWFRTA